MSLRDIAEATVRAWHRYELDHGRAAIIDFDCDPPASDTPPAPSRLEVHRSLTDLQRAAGGNNDHQLAAGIEAQLSYLRALLGERLPIDEYMRRTQGCVAEGWPSEHVAAVGQRAQVQLAALGVGWGSDTEHDLEEFEGRLDPAAAPDAIRRAADDLEAAVRQATGSDAPYELAIETTDVDAYWSYWLDGSGNRVRLRLNLRNAKFTKIRARQFALHEVLGHGLQSASFAQRSAQEDVPWLRLLSVHAPHQVLLEGLAQALPLFVTPHDPALTTRVRLDHYLQLVRAELHIAINTGAGVEDCAAHARRRVPFWTDTQIGDLLADRSLDPQLRSYLWAYPAGLDWFAALADADVRVGAEVMNAAYRAPLTPAELQALWPAGPLSEGQAALFVYGSLLFPDVRAALFQRQPHIAAASGKGWRVVQLKDRTYPGLIPADRSVKGLLLTDLTAAEWRMIDAFEDELYDLQELSLEREQQGWAYVCTPDMAVADGDWDAKLFATRHLSRYVAQCASWRDRYTATIGSDAGSVAG